MHERLAVYVPDPDAPAEAARTVAHIDRGSGIVGQTVVEQDREESPILVYYEGNRFGAVNMRRYAERVAHAAGRMEEHYPTIAKCLARPDGLLQIGWWYPQEQRVEIDGELPEPGRLLYRLAEWLDLPLDRCPTCGESDPNRCECPPVDVSGKLRDEMRCPARPMSATQMRDYMRRAQQKGFQPTREQLTDFAQAHAEGLHDEVPREFCPSCESQGRRA